MEREQRETTIRKFGYEDVVAMIEPDVVGMLQTDFDCHFEVAMDETAVQVDLVNQDRWWLRFKVRDRLFDGTPSYTPTKLTEWDYGKPEDQFTLGRAVETSSYWGHPGHPTTNYMRNELAQFVKNPFDAVPFDDPNPVKIANWHRLFEELQQVEDYPYPGKFTMQSLPGVWQYSQSEGSAIMRKLGYEYRTSNPTWYHISTLNDKYGFAYTDPADKTQIDKLKTLVSPDYKEASWQVVTQYVNKLTEENGLVPEEFTDTVLRDEKGNIITYPFTPEHTYWRHKKL